MRNPVFNSPIEGGSVRSRLALAHDCGNFIAVLAYPPCSDEQAFKLGHGVSADPLVRWCGRAILPASRISLGAVICTMWRRAVRSCWATWRRRSTWRRSSIGYSPFGYAVPVLWGGAGWGLSKTARGLRAVREESSSVCSYFIDTDDAIFVQSGSQINTLTSTLLPHLPRFFQGQKRLSFPWSLHLLRAFNHLATPNGV